MQDTTHAARMYVSVRQGCEWAGMGMVGNGHSGHSGRMAIREEWVGNGINDCASPFLRQSMIAA